MGIEDLKKEIAKKKKNLEAEKRHEYARGILEKAKFYVSRPEAYRAERDYLSTLSSRDRATYFLLKAKEEAKEDYGKSIDSLKQALETAVVDFGNKAVSEHRIVDEKAYEREKKRIHAIVDLAEKYAKKAIDKGDAASAEKYLKLLEDQKGYISSSDDLRKSVVAREKSRK